MTPSTQPSGRPPFAGLIPPVCTPLQVDGSVDSRSLARLLEHLLEAGVDGVFVLGSSGEAAYLDDRASRAVVDVARATVGGQVPLLVGALDTTAPRVLDRITQLGDAGVDAFVVTGPFYANTSATETAEHFRAIAAGCERPVIAYDIPGNVGRRLDRATMVDLLVGGVLAGLKDSSGTLDALRRIIDVVGEPRTVTLMTGVDSLADLALGIGADGLIPGLANIRPGYFRQIMDAHAAGDAPRMHAYQRAVTELTDVFGLGEKYGVGRHASELGALKHVLLADGVIASAALSCPMSPYPEPARTELLDLVADIDARLARRLESVSVPDTLNQL